MRKAYSIALMRNKICHNEVEVDAAFGMTVLKEISELLEIIENSDDKIEICPVWRDKNGRRRKKT